MCIRTSPGGRQGLVATGDEEKRAANEATFREANEQIRAADRDGVRLVRALDPREEGA